MRQNEVEPLNSARGCLIGQVPGLSEIEVLAKLGEGAFGTAHLVREKTSGQKRVLKTVRKGTLGSTVVGQEISVLKALDHPNIIRIFGHAEDQRHVYIIMEPAEGGELLAVIKEIYEEKRQTLSEAWVAQVMQQCLSAVSYCHARGILHKDLKSENIMLLDRERFTKPHAVVIDFGVAELLSPSNKARQGRPRGRLCAGTCTTMAPEVWLENFGPKCDVWSLGVVLYRLLTGRLPFMARDLNSATEWLRLHKAGPDWSLFGRLDAGARQLCGRMLVVDERLRPTAQQCMRHRWFDKASSAVAELDSVAVRALCEVHDQSVLERALYMSFVASLNAADMQQLMALFSTFDIDKSGTLSASEVVSALRAAGVDEANAERAAKSLQSEQRPESERQSSIEFSAFLAAVCSANDKLVEDALWKEFAKLDSDSDGRLGRSDVAKVLKGCDLESDKLWASVASNDGYITFDNLLKFFNSKGKLATHGTSRQEALEIQRIPSEDLAALALDKLDTLGTDVDALLDELGLMGDDDPTAISPEVTEALLDHALSDSDGALSEEEFRSWLTDLLAAPRVAAAARGAGAVFDFHSLDRNANGKLERAELRQLVEALQELLGASALRQIAEDWCRPEPSEAEPATPGQDGSRTPDVDLLLQELGL